LRRFSTGIVGLAVRLRRVGLCDLGEMGRSLPAAATIGAGEAESANAAGSPMRKVLRGMVRSDCVSENQPFLD